MTAAEHFVAESLNADIAFQTQGITVRRVSLDDLENKVIAVFDTNDERDRVAVIDKPEPGVEFLKRTENLLFARIFGKVA